MPNERPAGLGFFDMLDILEAIEASAREEAGRLMGATRASQVMGELSASPDARHFTV